MARFCRFSRERERERKPMLTFKLRKSYNILFLEAFPLTCISTHPSHTGKVGGSSFKEELCPTTSNYLGTYSYSFCLLKASSYIHKFRLIRVYLPYI